MGPTPVRRVLPRPDPRTVRRAGIARACVAALVLLGAAGSLGGCETVPLSDIGPALSDEHPLSVKVLATLDAAPETMHQNISVKTVGPGTVRLSGTVDTETTRTFAAQNAERVPGVENVINTLFIRY